MSITLIFWMTLLLGGVFGPFFYFANIAAKKEKNKN